MNMSLYEVDQRGNPRKFKTHIVLDLLCFWKAMDITKNQTWQSTL